MVPYSAYTLPEQKYRVSLIYPGIHSGERPAYTPFCPYGGGGWQYGLGLDQGLLWLHPALNIRRVI